jgi:anaerobic ribonucleoside-triphosphate reductase activating protein
MTGRASMPEINLHGLIPRSLVNGPGERFVIHVQGCSRKCPGCFNSDSLPNEIRRLISVDELLHKVMNVEGIEGVSLSGGEPLEQMSACLAFLHMLREKTNLSVLVYTGFTLEGIREMPHGDDFLNMVDILVDGPYIEEQKLDTGFLASSNQRVIFHSDRYSPKDIEVPGDFEIHVHPDGNIIMTGLPPKMEFG